MDQKLSDFRVSGATLAAALICTWVGAGAQAAWLTDVTATADSRYDDNVRLSTDGEEESAIATTAGGELHVRNVTETAVVEAIAGAKYLMYSGYDGTAELDNEDIQYGEIHARVRAERLQIGRAHV